MSSDNTNNYQLLNLSLKNSIIELNKPLTFSCNISNYSDETINNITVSLFFK